MSYRVIFWRPKPGVDPWLKAAGSTERIGEGLFQDVHAKSQCPDLEPIPTDVIIAAVKAAFSGISFKDDMLYWNDDDLGGLGVTCSAQHVSFTCFDLVGDDVLDRIFSLMKPFNLTHYDR